MARTIAGTLNVPDTGPLANAEIYFVAKRNEATKILQGVSSVITTNGSGDYSQSIEDGYYAVSLRYDDGSGNQLHRYPLGDVFVEAGSTITLNALLSANDSLADPTEAALQQLLADAQTARDEAVAAADSAEQDAASADFRTFKLGESSVSEESSDFDGISVNRFYAFGPNTPNYPDIAASDRGAGIRLTRAGSPSRFDMLVDTEGNLIGRSELSGVWRDYRLHYNRANILGGVAQSGGIPTGAIIERGSNANGEYLKFTDGTAFLSRRVSLDLTTSSIQDFDYPVSALSITDGLSRGFSVSGISQERTELRKTSGLMFTSLKDRWSLEIGSVNGATGTVLIDLFAKIRWA